jgi:gliding motility-associated-like protein
MQLTIYNQWGKQLAVITDIRKGWDGRANGTDMPAGVYAYVLKAVMQGGNEIVKNGTVNLLR